MGKVSNDLSNFTTKTESKDDTSADTFTLAAIKT